MESNRFDRFALSALERILRHLTEFVIVGGCPAHDDMHDAFRWSLFFQFREYGFLRNAHVTDESLRNSVSSTYQEISRSVDCAAREIQRTQKRLALSVDHDVGDLLAEDHQFEFARGVLRVSSTCQDRGYVVGLIDNVVGQSLGHARSRFAARSFAPKSGVPISFWCFCKILG